MAFLVSTGNWRSFNYKMYPDICSIQYILVTVLPQNNDTNTFFLSVSQLGNCFDFSLSLVKFELITTFQGMSGARESNYIAEIPFSEEIMKLQYVDVITWIVESQLIGIIGVDSLYLPPPPIMELFQHRLPRAETELRKYFQTNYPNFDDM